MINLHTAINQCLPYLEHYVSTHGAGPDTALADLKAALQMPASDLLIISSVKPAGGGILPCRISLHKGNSMTPYVTHLECQGENGRWSRASGHYFTADSLLEAVADYINRCKAMNVETS